MITDQPQPIDSYLQPVIGKFLETSRDADLQVRRVAIITLNAAVHNKPKMVLLFFHIKLFILNFRFAITSHYYFLLCMRRLWSEKNWLEK
jgi:hypothetical protein